MSAAVMPGAEPFEFAGGETGVLVCHGFTGTPQSMRGLAEAFARAGCTVSLPRLAGHGTSVEDMAGTGARDWTGSVDAAFASLRSRCARVFVAGLSMGGSLALHLAGRHPDAVAGAIAINAVVELDDPDLAALVFDPDAPAVVPGIGSDIKQEGVTELAYASVPVRCLGELHALAGVARALLPRVVCPTLIVTSREDHVVKPSNGDLIARRVGGRVERLILENSWHVATLDGDRALLEAEAVRFVQT